ncbi:MAG: cell division ATP-binding protein FtsE [Xanthomonadales bacterium]|nr:cell division ATP-binding protein FtsE [Xanthomonadales bacterium]MDL1869979.1 cell division ATP-binding protein FtsE [Gammaproteobacteria bacterium PRO6]
MIQFDNVTKRYQTGLDALSELSFAVAPGEVVFVTGHSGAGKSTLLKLVSLAERPTRGRISINGRELTRVRRGGIPQHRRGIGMVFQDHRLLTDRSVFDNVALPLLIAGTARSEIGKRVRAALDKVGLLSREKAAPVALSTGEQQRVGIARALVAKPPLILADEPTGNLDPQLSLEIMNLFVEFGAVGTTVLIATHDLLLLRHMRKRVLVLDHGRLVDDYRPEQT